MSADGRPVYKNPSLESLSAKLKGTRSITHALSTVKTEVADDARTFRRKCERYMDSTADVSGGSYWPLVKQVLRLPGAAPPGAAPPVASLNFHYARDELSLCT